MKEYWQVVTGCSRQCCSFIFQLLIEIIVSFHDFSRCLLYAFSYFRRVLAREYTLIRDWFGVRYKFFHKNRPFHNSS